LHVHFHIWYLPWLCIQWSPTPKKNQWYLSLTSAVIPMLHCWNLSAKTHNPFLTSFYKRKKVRGSFLKRQTSWPIRTWKASKGKASPKIYLLWMKLSRSPRRDIHPLLQHEQRYATLHLHHSCWRTKPQLQSLSPGDSDKDQKGQSFKNRYVSPPLQPPLLHKNTSLNQLVRFRSKMWEKVDADSDLSDTKLNLIAAIQSVTEAFWALPNS